MTWTKICCHKGFSLTWVLPFPTSLCLSTESWMNGGTGCCSFPMKEMNGMKFNDSMKILLYVRIQVKSFIQPTKCPVSLVFAAPAIQTGQRDSRCGGWIGDSYSSGKVAQLHLTCFHPSSHSHLPGRVGGPLTADHYYPRCSRGLIRSFSGKAFFCH